MISKISYFVCVLAHFYENVTQFVNLNKRNGFYQSVIYCNVCSPSNLPKFSQEEVQKLIEKFHSLNQNTRNIFIFRRTTFRYVNGRLSHYNKVQCRKRSLQYAPTRNKGYEGRQHKNNTIMLPRISKYKQTFLLVYMWCY